MIYIGMCVEGPSDRAFWDKVLHRHIPGVHFDIRDMKGRTKLIAAAVRMTNAFRAEQYAAVFLLVDLDDDPCITAVRDLFEIEARGKAEEERGFPSVCVAARELESWYLADEEAVRQATGCHDYSAPEETRLMATKTKLSSLLSQRQTPVLRYNEIQFAKVICGYFDPERARLRSASFDYFWSRLRSVVEAARAHA